MTDGFRLKSLVFIERARLELGGLMSQGLWVGFSDC